MSSFIQVSRLREAVTKTARLLTLSGVEVRQRGVQPLVAYGKDGRVKYVNLPMIPDDPSQEFMDVMQGFSDHECAHVLFTNILEIRSMDDKAKAEKLPQNVLASMGNIFEDVRINREMARKFKGSAHNITNAYRNIIEKVEPMVLASLKIPDPIERGKAVIGYAFVVWTRAELGDLDATKFMDKHDLWGFFESTKRVFPNYAKRLEAMVTSQDAAELAFDFVKATTPPPPPPPPPCPPSKSKGEDKPKPEEEDDEEGEGEETDADKEGSGKGDKDKPAEPGSDEGEDEADEGDKDADEDDGEGKGKAPAKPDDEAEEETEGGSGPEGEDDGEPEEEDNDGEPSGGSPGGEEDGESEADDHEENEGGTEESEGESLTEEEASMVHGGLKDVKDMDEFLGKVLAEMMPIEFKNAEYLEYTRDFDKIETAPHQETAPIDAWEAEVQKASGVMQKDLQRIITARSQSIMIPGFRRGRLNPSALHRLECGDDRIFRRKQESITKDVAVQLVVDCSGSMRGTKEGYYGGRGGQTKIELALKSAWAFAAVLDKLSIANEVIGFTTLANDRELDGEDVTKMVELTGACRNQIRTTPIYMPVFKDFGERFGLEQKKRIATPNEGWLRDNVDGACILEAGKRLIQRRETRKLMIVFSDGSPACSGMDYGVLASHLKWAVQQVEKIGIETVGVGIMDTNVKNFYPKSFVVNNIEELPAKVLGELRHFLTK